MRHVTLTCPHHPDLRWTTKRIAFKPGCGYDGSRTLYYQGHADYLYDLAAQPPECSCSARDLILAPEDKDYGQDRITD